MESGNNSLVVFRCFDVAFNAVLVLCNFMFVF